MFTQGQFPDELSGFFLTLRLVEGISPLRAEGENMPVLIGLVLMMGFGQRRGEQGGARDGDLHGNRILLLNTRHAGLLAAMSICQKSAYRQPIGCVGPKARVE